MFRTALLIRKEENVPQSKKTRKERMRLQQPFAIQKKTKKLKIVLLFWWMTSIPLDELFSTQLLLSMTVILKV